MAKKPVIIEIPEQGVSLKLTLEEAKLWAQEEQRLFNEMTSFLNQQFNIFGWNLHTNLVQSAVQEMARISKKLAAEDATAFETYVEKARALEFVVAQGEIGRSAVKLNQDNLPTQARLLMMINSIGWLGGNEREAAQALRAAAFANPAMVGAQDILVARRAEKLATEAREESEQARNAFNEYVEGKRVEVDRLEQLYRDKLTLEAPAALWRRAQERKNVTWLNWFVVFTILVLVPIAAAMSFSEKLAAFVVHVTATSTGGVSLGGIAAITVPALFYAWLLKNVSRLFIQAHTLADDAAHREALALTYLGLAENPKLSIGEQERALVLNALFRPLPTQSHDDGPPAGLLDLIRNKNP